jgi:hypothetical protein
MSQDFTFYLITLSDYVCKDKICGTFMRKSTEVTDGKHERKNTSGGPNENVGITSETAAIARPV